ncbi:MAG: CPBP family intramembrane metalloprotease [Candidatus Omnitrophica bacterium]|nr:CPBP family intramembrane metalloprotease [Candidatus Omnitrophota bacterium]
MSVSVQNHSSLRSAIGFASVAAIGCTLWFFFSFPQLTTLHLSIQREEALRLAASYLKDQSGVDPALYQTAVVFSQDDEADRYLQKALGARAGEFFSSYDYEFSRWAVRFFRQGEKEEYYLLLGAGDGRVLRYLHTIDDNAARQDTNVNDARALAERVLSGDPRVDLLRYELKDVATTRLDHRTDYTFSWKHRDVDIPWTVGKKDGTAKLMLEAVVSGGEVLSYHRAHFVVPDGFTRYLDRETEAGRLLSLLFFIIYFVILLSAIYQAVRYLHHLAIREARPFLNWMSTGFFVLMVLGVGNLFETFVMEYPTSQLLWPFLSRTLLQVLMPIFFITVGLLLVAIGGECLRQRSSESGKKDGFLYYIRSSFFSRDILRRVGIGYAVGSLLLGVQAAILVFGQKTVGVWSESYWITQFSSAYVPALAALVLSIKASLTEEVTYRAYVIPQLKAWTGNWVVAVIVSALVWGLGHAGYLIFPTWFRCVEMTVLGVILAITYIRWGLVSVIVAHYFFDVFWSSAGCLWGQVRPLYFYSSLGIVLLPFIWGVVSFWINGTEKERLFTLRLNRKETFNADILRAFVREKLLEGEGLDSLRQACLNNGWDPAIVQDVFSKEIAKKA